MAKRPWRNHLTQKWATDPFVRSLDLEARMVYFELLDIAWEEDGLRQEWVSHGTYVAQRIGISRRKFVAIWSEVRVKFVEISPGIWSNPKLESERKTADFASEKQAKRAKQKWAAYAAAVPANDTAAMPSTTTTTTTAIDQKKPSPVSPGDFEAVYAKYPRKEGRKKGEQRFKSQITTRSKYDALMRAVENYAAQVTDTAYAKHFDTFMGCWEDYADAGLLTPRPSSQSVTGHAKPAPHNTETRDYEF